MRWMPNVPSQSLALTNHQQLTLEPNHGARSSCLPRLGGHPKGSVTGENLCGVVLGFEYMAVYRVSNRELNHLAHVANTNVTEFEAVLRRGSHDRSHIA